MDKMNKEDFQTKAKKSIDDIFAKIDELEAKKDKAKVDVKAEYQERLNILKVKKDELQANYDLLLNTSNERWEEVKGAFSSATDSFKEGFAKLASLL